jgi:hypothetical protein
MIVDKQKIISYVAGIVTGIICTCLFAFYVGSRDKGLDNGIELFDKPRQEIKAKEFDIMQVLPNGNALAQYNKFTLDDSTISIGTVVMFLSSKEGSFYDDQKIKLQKGKLFRQIGTYRYQTTQGIEKTVPIVGVFDK